MDTSQGLEVRLRLTLTLTLPIMLSTTGMYGEGSVPSPDSKSLLSHALR